MTLRKSPWQLFWIRDVSRSGSGKSDQKTNFKKMVLVQVATCYLLLYFLFLLGPWLRLLVKKSWNCQTCSFFFGQLAQNYWSIESASQMLNLFVSSFLQVTSPELISAAVRLSKNPTAPRRFFRLPGDHGIRHGGQFRSRSSSGSTKKDKEVSGTFAEADEERKYGHQLIRNYISRMS